MGKSPLLSAVGPVKSHARRPSGKFHREQYVGLPLRWPTDPTPSGEDVQRRRIFVAAVMLECKTS